MSSRSQPRIVEFDIYPPLSAANPPLSDVRYVWDCTLGFSSTNVKDRSSEVPGRFEF